MNMPFSEFEKMPKGLKSLNLSEKQLKEIEKSKWVVTEKAHGANFSWVYENKQLRVAKRKEYLAWNDDFFGFQLVVHRLEAKIYAFFETISKSYTAEKYILYGELIGGAYPHEKVTQSPDLQAIQTGIYYSPDIEFYAFDIALESKNVKTYLPYQTSVSYFEQFQFLHAKPLFIGKFADCLAFNPRISSTIPHELGLPLIDNNLMEGIVIKLYQNPKNMDYNPRIILKIRNIEFEEEKKFHEAEKWSYIPNLDLNSQNLAFILEEMLQYLNENRLNSAISKIGTLNLAHQSQIKNEILSDIWADFNENYDHLLNELTENQAHWLQARLKAEIDNFIV